MCSVRTKRSEQTNRTENYVTELYIDLSKSRYCVNICGELPQRFLSVSTYIAFLGRPGAPSAPIKFEEIGAEKITLSWLPPKDDGGSKVTNYVIWRRVANRKTWVPVTSEPKERIWTVENLMEGHEYVFRIMAQNKYGVGEPLDSDPEVARNLYSECS